jgi:hypothetical protein
MCSAALTANTRRDFQVHFFFDRELNGRVSWLAGSCSHFQFWKKRRIMPLDGCANYAGEAAAQGLNFVEGVVQVTFWVRMDPFGLTTRN